MTGSVTRERWADAQAAEAMYWDMLTSDAVEFARILAEKTTFAVWATAELNGALPKGDWLELGIGPLGIGCVHLLDTQAEHALVGVDPLPPLDLDDLTLPPVFRELVRACGAARYTHVRAAGEETGLDSGRFGLVATYNVLDHVCDPGGVLQEAHRLLRPGGVLLLACDTVSWVSLMRYRVDGRRRIAGTLGGRAHPFRFRERELLALVEASGFRIRADTLRGTVSSLLGRRRRLCVIAERAPAGDDGSGL